MSRGRCQADAVRAIYNRQSGIYNGLDGPSEAANCRLLAVGSFRTGGRNLPRCPEASRNRVPVSNSSGNRGSVPRRPQYTKWRSGESRLQSVTFVLSAGWAITDCRRTKGRGRLGASFQRSSRRSYERSFEASLDLSFQASFALSFRRSFEASDERSDATSFETSHALSDETSFDLSFRSSSETSS